MDDQLTEYKSILNSADSSFKKYKFGGTIHKPSDFQACGDTGTLFHVNGTVSPNVHISYNSRNTTDVNTDDILQKLLDELGLNENVYNLFKLNINYN